MGYRIRKAISDDEQRIRELFIEMLQTIYPTEEVEGYGAILFFGRPEYYPQFGFVEASEFFISDSEGYNYDSFMGMELIPGYLSIAKGGRFYESEIYNDDLNRESVKKFDAEFNRAQELNF